jgi:glucose-6-phosphate isomerase
MLKINTSSIDPGFMGIWRSKVAEADLKLKGKTAEGNDFLGWLDLPANVDPTELSRIHAAAERIRSNSEVLLVIGIGGSYLGARAVIEALKGTFYNLNPQGSPQVFFVGNNLSTSYAEDILKLIDGKDFSINVISKSGTTTEPAVAFRIFKQALEKKYGLEEAKKRIYATTDKERGALKKLSDTLGYESFVIPDDVGGRFSVFTPVGLLPIAVAGIDIDALLKGALDMAKICAVPGTENPAWQYAAARNALLSLGKTTEITVTYDPDFVFLAEWYKQLFGESEGKDNKGIFPAAVNFTADLHSMGQYIQEGVRNLFETVILVEESASEIQIEEDQYNVDGLNFLAGKTLSSIERQAFRGTYLAHSDGGVPNLVISLSKKDEENLGQLLYFYEYSCGLSGYTLGVNPFNQPGVEAYKENMFALLGKPGYEADGKALEARLPKGI